MRNQMFIIAVILVIAWGVGFIGYSLGGLINVLLVIAFIVTLLWIIQGDKILS